MLGIFNTDFYDQKTKELKKVRFDIFQIRFGVIEPNTDYRDIGLTVKGFIKCLEIFTKLNKKVLN